MEPDFFRKRLADDERIVVGLDPGETTGYCVFAGSKLMFAEQLTTKKVGSGANYIKAMILNNCHLLSVDDPHAVVIEEYRVYGWKTNDHAWSELHTARLIGAIEYIAYDESWCLVKQGAQQAKQFCTDDKLKAWGFWIEGQRHARDAIRHAAFYLLFGKGGTNHEIKK